MKHLVGHRAGALVSVTLLSLALLGCGPVQSGDDTEPSKQGLSTDAGTPPTQVSPSEAVSPDPRRRRGPAREAPNPDKEEAIRAGDLDAVVLEWKQGLRSEVTSFRVINSGTKSVGRFAIAIRFLDANGKRLKTEYVEVGREGIAGKSEKTFSVHISGPAGAESVEAEIVSDITSDRVQESMRMMQEEASGRKD